MGTGYTRNDTSNNIADGNVIDAADLDGEFDSIQAAFNSTTGHTHDGTSAEGAPITVTGPAQEYVSTGTELRAKTTNTYDLGSSGVQWKDLYVDGTGYIDTLNADAATVNGNITVTGTVDGRDIAADGTKLDGIESGATADQTAAEIKTAYESNANTNAFTDAEQTKLAGIEANATADQTASEILTAIKTVDGSGSGLDADLLDGLNSDAFVAVSGDTMTGTLAFGDNVKATYGAGADLEIYHDGSNSLIRDTGTGDLQLRGSHVALMDAGGNHFIYCTDTGTGGTVEIKHLGATKLATTSTGVDITGNITVTGTVDGRDVATDGTKLDGIEAGADVTDTANVTAAGALMDSELTNITAVKALNQGVATSDSPTFAGLTSTGDVYLGNGDTIRLGSGNYAQIAHDGTDLYLVSSLGSTYIRANADDNDIILESDNGSGGTTTYVLCDGSTGSVKLHHYGSEKFATRSDGISVTGTIFPDGLDMEDNHQIKLGTSDDLLIYHDGSNSYVQDNGSGSLLLKGTNLSLQANNGENYLNCTENAGVAIRYNNSTKLETTTYGVSVTGSAVASTLTGSVSGSVTLGFDSYQNFVLTLTGNVTLANPTTEKVGQSGFITIIHSGAGRTVSLGTDYETAGGAGLTLSATAGATDIVPYIVAASGRILLGTPQLAFS